MQPVILQAQEGAEGEANVGDLGAGGADLSPFHAAALLEAAVVVCAGPGLEGQLLPAGRGQVQIAAGPVFRAAVVGHGPEYAYEAIAPPDALAAPAAGISRSRITTLPLPSGLTWRLDLSRVSQAHPNWRRCFRLSRLLYQLSQST